MKISTCFGRLDLEIFHQKKPILIVKGTYAMEENIVSISLFIYAPLGLIWLPDWSLRSFRKNVALHVSSTTADITHFHFHDLPWEGVRKYRTAKKYVLRIFNFKKCFTMIDFAFSLILWKKNCFEFHEKWLILSEDLFVYKVFCKN